MFFEFFIDYMKQTNKFENIKLSNKSLILNAKYQENNMKSNAIGFVHLSESPIQLRI